MARRGSFVLGVAVCLAAVDVAHKALVESPEWALHVRSGAWELLAAALVIGCVVLTRVPSNGVVASAGLLAGGALGNLSSSLFWDSGIPNPILMGESTIVAFNLADVFTLAGICSLMVALIVVTVRHREQLLPPREVARRVWRRLVSSA